MGFDITNLIAVFFVISGIGIAAHIAIDLNKNKQSMKIMNAVWILTGLWGSYLALWSYNQFGQEKPGSMSMNMKGMKMDMKGMDMSHMKMDMNMKGMKMDMPMDMDMSGGKPHWQSVALSALHCGAGCTLADILGEWITSVIPMHIGGSIIAGNWWFDFFLALIIGGYFQFYAIREMANISV